MGGRKAAWLAGAGVFALGGVVFAETRDAGRPSEGVTVVSAGREATAANTMDTNAQATAAVSNGCVAGTWSSTNNSVPIRLETPHFAIRWTDGSGMTTAQSEKLTTKLERVFDVFTNQIGFPSPDCGSTAKRKINVFIDPSYGAAGGLDDNDLPAFWASPNIADDLVVLAHEMTHSLQGASGGLRNSPYTGWFWESHAEWMVSQLPEMRSSFTGCAANAVMQPHFSYDNTPLRYCGWRFLEYLKNKKGYAAVNDLWTKSPRPNDAARYSADVLSVLRANLGWTVGQTNDFFGELAMHNVNWDYINPDGSDQGAIYRTAFGSNDDTAGNKRLRVATLDPVNLSTRKFSIPFSQAPQRYGYNIVKLFPDAGRTSISVTFKGIPQTTSATTTLPGMANEPSSIPAPASGWRWGLVAIDANGKSRYSTMSAAANGTTSIAVQSGDKSFWLVVLGAPTQNVQVVWYQAYYSLYRYPWMAQFTGAMPSGFQPNAPKPTARGHAHANGGGWVADGANVASTAYVGPYAKVLGGNVLGNARIEDHAVIQSGTVQDSAIVGALSLISENSVIKDQAKVATVFEGIRASTVSGTAQHLGDTNYYGFTVWKGVQYGVYEEQAAFDQENRGATRTTAVPEVTAKPNYSW